MTSTKVYTVSPGWRILLRDLGLSTENILRRADLPGELFVREKAVLTTEEYFRLWRGVEEEAEDPLLPLTIGAAISVEAFDPPIFAALCSPDLITALKRLSHYKKLIAPMALHVDAGGSGVTLEIEWLDKSDSPPGVLVLSELVFFIQLARIATRTKVLPIEVRSPHLPEQGDEYTKYFGVAVDKGPAPRLSFTPGDAARPFLTANEKMWAFFKPELQKRLSKLDESASTYDRVHAALLELLPGGAASIASVSKKIGASTRTLQRRLKKEGLSYQTVLNGTRESLAKHYLKNSGMSGAEISFLLGFEDPNSFFRAFNSWTGKTPEQARRRMAG